MFRDGGDHQPVSLPGVSVHEAYVALSSASAAPQVQEKYRVREGSTVKRIYFSIPGARSATDSNPMSLPDLAKLVEKTLEKTPSKGLKTLQRAFPAVERLEIGVGHPAARVAGGACHGAVGTGLNFGSGPNMFDDELVAQRTRAEREDAAMQHGVAACLPFMALASASGYSAMECEPSLAEDAGAWSPFSFYSKEEQLKLYGNENGVAEYLRHRERPVVRCRRCDCVVVILSNYEKNQGLRNWMSDSSTPTEYFFDFIGSTQS